MNVDKIMGSGRRLAGKAESALGEAIGDEKMEMGGVIDQIEGAVQNGLGHLKDSARDIADAAPENLKRAAKRGRKAAHRANAEVRHRLGDDGPLYLLAGAIGLAALGAFALRRR
jgi:uncharacterized protein YjbJ (UPF0337 family)